MASSRSSPGRGANRLRDHRQQIAIALPAQSLTVLDDSRSLGLVQRAARDLVGRRHPRGDRGVAGDERPQGGPTPERAFAMPRKSGCSGGNSRSGPSTACS